MMDTYKKALQAIKDLFSDKSKTVDEAYSDLQALKDEIDILLDSMEYEL